MHLYAIAIYRDEVNEDGVREVCKMTFAQKSKPSFFDAKPDDLRQLEQDSFGKLPKELKPNGVYAFNNKDEHHYFMKSPTGNTLMAIASRNRLEDRELTYLFRNIHHAYYRGKTIDLSLDYILMNPLRFIKSDAQIDKINEGIEEVRTITLANIEKVIERGEDLKELERKTIHLADDAKVFQKRSKEVNRCCRW